MSHRRPNWSEITAFPETVKFMVIGSTTDHTLHAGGEETGVKGKL